MSDQTDATMRRAMAAYVGISPDPPLLPEPQLRRRSRRPALAFAFAFISVVVIGVATVTVMNLRDTAPTGGGPAETTDPLSWTHLTVTHEQTIDLKCEGEEVFDHGGFDEVTFDVWRDPDALLTRVQATYPDGSTHDLVFEGPAGNWQRAWARGADHGRQAGCVDHDDGSSSLAYAGEVWLDFGPGPAIRFLVPLQFEDDQVGVYVFVEDRETAPAFESFERDAGLRWYQYTYDSRTRTTTTLASWYYPLGPRDEPRAEFVALRTVWYGIDPATSELQQFERAGTSPWFDVSITATVTASEAGLLGADVFDLTGYQPVWGRETPVVTTNPPPP